MHLSLHDVESLRIIERRMASDNKQYFSIKIVTDTDIHNITLFVADNTDIEPVTLLGGVLQ